MKSSQSLRKNICCQNQAISAFSPHAMYKLCKTFLLWVILYAGIAHSRNGCRQCEGFETIWFRNKASLADATAYMRASLGNCATGNDYSILLAVGTVCDDCVGRCPDDKLICYRWWFDLRIWRYCGNGARLMLDKRSFCNNGLCSFKDFLSLECLKSVECRGDCKCRTCGC